ncbi:hypothetical protein [uncultured Pseudoflavonifractor sp.]|uniref:hypothetical protein n=1 Tax=uncultured Pseudoflavonifractor sp. TaxID=1221379 RepID=UPI0025FB57D5|nr:hypothetical protein [uncultured Pseudoflavonifractor sp.]
MEHTQEACAKRQHVQIGARDGLLVHCLGSIPPAAGGCVAEFSFTLPAVPPDTRTAVAITLLELDQEGRAFPRGMRTLLLPAHHGARPMDVQAEGVRFILPAELDLSGDGVRRLVVQAESQYVDFHARCDMRE